MPGHMMHMDECMMMQAMVCQHSILGCQACSIRQRETLHGLALKSSQSPTVSALRRDLKKKRRLGRSRAVGELIQVLYGKA